MENCIFCKIISGDIPCYKVFENDKIFAFLDISPIAEGHTLIIPKKHFSNIFEIDNDYLQELILVAKELAIKMKLNLGAAGVNIFQSNGIEGEQTVFHFHLHLIPRKDNDGINFSEVLVKNIKKLESERFEEVKNIFIK
ncbi:MAG: HIT family protein [Candidatus Paceibacterota bacterium]|jgi:histidine triad (HIT) family protein|nr:HIT family protein [bacterium]